MKNFRNDREDRGRGGWGGPKKFGGPKPWDRGGADRGGRGGDREEREMFKATCSECGDMCQVPFRPRDGRPVFCNNCFRKDEDQGGSFERRPSFDKPSRDFSFREDRAPERTPRADRSQDDFKAINAKLDAIMKTLASLVPPPTQHVVKKEEPKKEEPKEEKKVAKKKATKKKAA